MPDSLNPLRQLPGKPLWSAALMFWLTVGAAQAEDLSWAFDVARAHIAENYAWPTSEYHLRIRYQEDGIVALYVRHKDDEGLGKRISQGPWVAGGGKSFEIYLDEETRTVVKELHDQ
ncbi:MAG: hypothetical protein ACFCUW_08545 [Kiloniellaceae bacterium]